MKQQRIPKRRKHRAGDPSFVMGFSVLFLSLWTLSILGISSMVLWQNGSTNYHASRSLILDVAGSDDPMVEPSSNARPQHATISNGPKIVWLMSFPNSGTSFTSRLVREASRTMTATNYADEEDTHEPVYEDQPMGPFWIHQDDFEPPDRYVLTKTHCGLRCGECPPEEYAETTYSFRRKCALTKSLDNKHANYDFYDFDRVEKAIHLIRNPFDNVVSRFHLLTAKQHNQKYDKDTKHGFLQYCLHIDRMFTRNEIKYAHFKNVPELRALWLGMYGFASVGRPSHPKSMQCHATPSFASTLNGTIWRFIPQVIWISRPWWYIMMPIRK